MHLMTAGRLQLYDKRGSLRDRTSRVLMRLPEDRELRLREFGTKQAAWVKLLRAGRVEDDEALARRSARRRGPTRRELGELLDSAAPAALAAARPAGDRRHRAHVGRRDPPRRQALAVQARRRPVRRARRGRCARRWSPSSGACSTSTRSSVELPLPEKFPKPTRVHAHQGEPCPRCETDARGGLLRGLRDDLLPALPDRGADPQGPPALAPAQVATSGRLRALPARARRSRARPAAARRARDAGSGRSCVILSIPNVTRRPKRLGRSFEPCSRQAPRPPISRCPTRTATRSRSRTCAASTVVLYFYPKADTPGLHDAGLRHPRPPRRLRRGRRDVVGVSPDPVKAVKKFHGGQGAELHAARRRGPRGLRALRHLGREADVRAHLHGRAARDVHHRRRGHIAHVIP